MRPRPAAAGGYAGSAALALDVDAQRERDATDPEEGSSLTRAVPLLPAPEPPAPASAGHGGGAPALRGGASARTRTRSAAVELEERERPDDDDRAPDVFETGRHPAAARPDASGRFTPPAQSAARPLVLASAALRRELAPAAPAARPVRVLSSLLGVVGVVGVWWLSGLSGIGLPVGGALFALAVMGAVPMPYSARAASLATIGGSGLLVVTWHRFEGAAESDSIALMLGVIVLAMALLFRAWHRASWLARALVAVGIALCAGWLWTSGALPRLLVLDSHVQAWLGPVLSVPFAILLMLSLLAFMDSRTTGGCAVWAAILLGWYVIRGWSELAVTSWPVEALRPALQLIRSEAAVTLFAAPLFAIALSIALSQLLAVATAAETD